MPPAYDKLNCRAADDAYILYSIDAHCILHASSDFEILTGHTVEEVNSICTLSEVPCLQLRDFGTSVEPLLPLYGPGRVFFDTLLWCTFQRHQCRASKRAARLFRRWTLYKCGGGTVPKEGYASVRALLHVSNRPGDCFVAHIEGRPLNDRNGVSHVLVLAIVSVREVTAKFMAALNDGRHERETPPTHYDDEDITAAATTYAVAPDSCS